MLPIGLFQATARRNDAAFGETLARDKLHALLANPPANPIEAALQERQIKVDIAQEDTFFKAVDKMLEGQLKQKAERSKQMPYNLYSSWKA